MIKILSQIGVNVKSVTRLNSQKCAIAVSASFRIFGLEGMGGLKGPCIASLPQFLELCGCIGIGWGLAAGAAYQNSVIAEGCSAIFILAPPLIPYRCQSSG